MNIYEIRHKGTNHLVEKILTDSLELDSIIKEIAEDHDYAFYDLFAILIATNQGKP